MLITAKLMNKTKALGQCDVNENCQLIYYGGCYFVRRDAPTGPLRIFQMIELCEHVGHLEPIGRHL